MLSLCFLVSFLTFNFAQVRLAEAIRIRRQAFASPFALPDFAKNHNAFDFDRSGASGAGAASYNIKPESVNPFATGATQGLRPGSISGLPPLSAMFGTGVTWYNPFRLGGNFYTTTQDDEYPVFDFGGRLAAGRTPLKVDTSVLVHPVNNYVNLEDDEVRDILENYMLASSQVPSAANNYDPVGSWLHSNYGRSETDQLRALTAVNRAQLAQDKYRQQLQAYQGPGRRVG